MGIKNTVFFLDLKTLSSKPDSKLKAFAKSEDLEVEDIIKIIYAEAERIKEEDKVKVTFKMIDDDEDSFRVIVESANVKYKGTIIYPYNKIKSDDFEFELDSVCGTITLVNKKEDCKKISVTIDGAALDIFSMKYNDAKDFLKELSDRKGKKGYIEYPDGICFKHFGIKLNAQKAENGDVLVDSKVASINVYNQEEFDKAFYFEPEKQEQYDVNIPLPDEYNYEKKETKKKKAIVVEKEEEKKEEVKEEVKEIEEAKIEIELPEEKSKEELEKEAQEKREKEDKEREEQRKKNQEELDLIRKRQEEELEKVKEKFRRELEEDINKNIQKYEEEKLEKVELPDSIKEEKAEEKVEEIKTEEPEITGPIIVNPVTPKVEDILQDEDEEEEIEENNNIPHKDGFAELQKKFKILTDELDDEEEQEDEQEDFEDEKIEEVKPQTIKQPEEDFDIKDLDEVLGRTRKEEPKEEKDNDNEIEVLEKMLEEGKRQQEILEQRITAKLEELKAQVKAKEEPKKEEVKETKKTTKKEAAKTSLQDLEKEIEDLEEEIIEPKAAPKKETKKTVKKEEKVEEKVEENENTIRSYTLESYKGLIDNSTNTLIVYFGQSKKDIRKILGKPKQIRDFEEMEMYEDFYVYYDEEDKCVGIGLYNDKKYETTLSLSMFDRNLIDMKYRHIVKLIKRNDPNSIEDDDGIISLKYGISVDPRESKDSADDICDVIHIFQKGYYDEVYENF
ncbi:MAG: hypothetical protein IKD74_02575 [Clostridia bacterium]|nr:hypothetical protein [Clostridia bacterium]